MAIALDFPNVLGNSWLKGDLRILPKTTLTRGGVIFKKNMIYQEQVQTISNNKNQKTKRKIQLLYEQKLPLDCSHQLSLWTGAALKFIFFGEIMRIAPLRAAVNWQIRPPPRSLPRLLFEGWGNFQKNLTRTQKDQETIRIKM